jgi:hypothetical protein
VQGAAVTPAHRKRSLIPFPLLRSHDVWRLEEEYGYSKKLIAFRVMLLQQLSI